MLKGKMLVVKFAYSPQFLQFITHYSPQMAVLLEGEHG